MANLISRLFNEDARKIKKLEKKIHSSIVADMPRLRRIGLWV